MRKKSRLLALVLGFVMVAAFVFAAAPPTRVAASEETTEASETERQIVDGEYPLVYGIEPLSGKFSPFYSETAYDADVVSMVHVGLLTTDRQGNIIFNAIEGETHEYNGTPYLYTGIADLAIERVDEGTDAEQSVYTFKLRDDLVFSDGEPLTAKDVIFSAYVLLDRAYVGSSTLQSLPIVGLNEYRTQTNPAVYEKYAGIFEDAVEAGADGEVDGATPEMVTEIWASIDEAWAADVTAQVDSAWARYGEQSETIIGVPAEAADDDPGVKNAFWLIAYEILPYDVEGELTLENTGMTYVFANDEYPTLEEVVAELKAASDGDPYTYEKELECSFMDEIREDFIVEWGPQDEEMAGESVLSITGINMVDDYTVEFTLNGFDASAVYKLGLTVAPLHYYGDADLFDPENGQYGFPMNDLSSVEEKNGAPVGAGPYKFVEWTNKVVYFVANENYYRGEPKIKNLQFRETATADQVPGVANGTIDITTPSFSVPNIEAIKGYNGNDDIDGPVIVTSTVDNLGYGYVGINADTVLVDEPDSEASKNLRRAFATVIAVYRDLAVDSYYGDRASVINYPISNTSWAAPQETDEGYEIAFSTDVDGNPIYTADMSADERYEAAREAAIGFLKAAGYTFDDATGTFTAAPGDAKLEYTFYVPAGGTGDHPAFLLCTKAKEVFDSLGFNLIIDDPSDWNVMLEAIAAGTHELWTMAWGASIDPDMYQIYHSNNIIGKENSTGDNHYHIADAELDELIMEARTSDDQEFRKTTYKAALDRIIDWAVEIPTYQRQNAVIFSAERVNLDTLTPDITTFWGWSNDIELLEMQPVD